MISEPEINFLCKFLIESEKIEGIWNDENIVFEKIKSGASDEKQIIGHEGALLMLWRAGKDKVKMDENLVQRTQDLIVREQHLRGEQKLSENDIGNWRKCEVYIGYDQGVPYKKVPVRMTALISKLRKLQTKFLENPNTSSQTKAVARFHFWFEKIHPFADGNGRSGRALAFYLCLYFGIRPFVFEDKERSLYFSCLKEKTPKAMERFFKTCMEKAPA